MENVDNLAFGGVGTETTPCKLVVPDGFDFGEDVDPTEEVIEWCSGFFTLGIEYKMGDVNVDGEVTVTDVMLTVNHIMGQDDEAFHSKYADINQDGEINVTDVMLIVGIILN